MAQVLAMLLSGQVNGSHCMQRAQNPKLKTMTICKWTNYPNRQFIKEDLCMAIRDTGDA